MEKDLNKIWNSVLVEIKTEVSQANYGFLFKQTHLISIEDDIATVGAPSVMIINLLQTRFISQIKKLLHDHSGKELAVYFVIKSKPIINKGRGGEGPLFEDAGKMDVKNKPVSQVIGHLPRVRSDFTFSNFAVSSTNQLAFVSAQNVASNIGRSYNPFFIYGPVGVGKTHLMHAIANHTYKNEPSKKIIYITSEEFTNEVVEAIRNNETAKMKRRFRSAYLLLIDDIQFIEGKEKVQEELFHTFNILIDNGSQIVLSSDRPPQEIKRIERRLSSRFAGGLTVDIQKPDFELKAAILLIKAKKYNCDLPIDVAKLLAEYAEDTRTLEGLLLRIITQANASQSPITYELTKQVLSGTVEEKRDRMHPDDVIKNVCTYYKIRPTQLKGPKRDAGLVRARHVAMYILKEKLRLTQVEIGNLLGGRDHTTIMHGVEKINKLVENKDGVSEDIVGIIKQFNG